MKDKTTAALLAFFLGGFGVHKFYLGEKGRGAAHHPDLHLDRRAPYPGVMALIDFIKLLTMSQADFDAQYN